MLQMTIFTLREGIEAFLIVAITAAYLKKTGREALLSAVWSATGLSVALSLVLGVFLAEFAVQPRWEALLSAVAAALVVSMVVYMTRHARKLRSEIGQGLESAAVRPGAGAWLGVFALVTLMVTREGIEIAFITASLTRQAESLGLVSGALIGIALAAGLAWAWSRYGHRVNLALFFQVTSVFLVLFAIQLLVGAFHEATEAALLPIDNAYWHVVTEPYGPEGEYGMVFSFALVLIPIAWMLLYGYYKRPPRPRGPGAPTRRPEESAAR